VAENLRVTAGLARVFAATSFAHAAVIVLDRGACGAHYVPPGGSTRHTTVAYADAARELLEQVSRGELPLPDVVVVPLGSGGTAAGLAAGFARADVAVPVVGVLVSEPRAWVKRRTRRMAEGCLSDLAPSVGPDRLRLSIDEGYLGGGYGHATAAGVAAIAEGARLGLTLEPTYTGKTFAAVLDRAKSCGPVLYWHTLSSAPLEPLLERSPREVDLRAEERALLAVG
jgi:1-aminocyclopropane-1-carboxylate deaminase/D-cysteine desulfhydrase-like pyridoxal-dependent ACC family enzyme